ncbi:LRRC15 [Symbiodinium sp. CCMP2592]|nr:LRRC15 [Symbiodinium sp. CCMP2592]
MPQARGIGEVNTSRGNGSGQLPAWGAERRLQGRLTGGQRKENETLFGQMVGVEAGKLPFGLVHPDWAGPTATLSFSLDLEVGGQSFETDFLPITLHRGLPAPTDVLCLLIGEKDASTEVLKSEGSVDGEGNVVITIAEYDPTIFKRLRLLVMPLLPDPALRANWSEWSAASKEDKNRLKKHSRCQTSDIVNSRYMVCGAPGGVTHGRPLNDEPVVVSLDSWLGRPRTQPTFSIVRRDGQDTGLTRSFEEHAVTLEFEGVDSPAAWAAHHHGHGCTLLNSTDAERGILASADAICRLLSSCADRLCEKVRDDTLGGAQVYNAGARSWQHPSPSVSAEQTVNLLTCLKEQAPSCSRSITQRQWNYANNAVQLKDSGIRVPIGPVIRLADKSGQGGLALIREIRQNLTLENATVFDQHAAREVWALLEPSSDLLATVAALSQTGPELVAQALMRSPSGKMPKVTTKLQAAFAHLTELRVQLEDAAQLRHLVDLAQLAPRLQELSLSCSFCPATGKVPSREDLQGLSKHRELEKLSLSNFQVRTLPARVFQGLGKLKTLNLISNQLQTLSPEVFQGLGELQELNLVTNKLQTLPPKVFHGLGQLKGLSLASNQLQTLPPKVFHGLGELHELNLGDNQLQTLPTEVFQGLGELHELNLDDNQLQTLPTEVFQGLGELEVLDLAANQLQTLPPEVFQGLGKLRSLRGAREAEEVESFLQPAPESPGHLRRA